MNREPSRNVAIIPARGGSEGIRNKNLIQFCGRPLIYWTIKQALASTLVSDVFVTSDSETILEHAARYGASAIKRPYSISGPDDSSESALSHAMEEIQRRGVQPDLIVFLQATSPCRKLSDIDNAVKQFLSSEFDSIFSGCIVSDLTLWTKKNGQVQPLNYDYKNRLTRQTRDPNIIENGSIYLFTPEVLTKNNNRFGENIGFYEMDLWQSWELDTIHDLDILEYFFTKHSLRSQLSPVDDVDHIILDFDGVFTDNRVLTLEDGTEGVFCTRGDGLAVQWLKSNFSVRVLSTEINPVVEKRCQKLGLIFDQGIQNKESFLRKLADQSVVDLSRTLYVGNDINDLGAMNICLFSACPSDASLELHFRADLVLESRGGHGVLRELKNVLLTTVQ